MSPDFVVEGARWVRCESTTLRRLAVTLASVILNHVKAFQGRCGDQTIPIEVLTLIFAAVCTFAGIAHYLRHTRGTNGCASVDLAFILPFTP